MQSIRTPEKRLAFLAVLAETGMIAKACAGAGISRSAAYEWRAEESGFAREWEKALGIGITALEDEAHRRGFDGVEKHVYHLGQVCGEWKDSAGKRCSPDAEDAVFHPHIVREYSDTLAIFLLKSHRPDKYRERGMLELTGAGGGPIQSLSAAMSPEQAAQAYRKLMDG